MFRLRRHWDARKPECIESAKHTVIHVGIKEFSCALVVLTMGVVVSLSTLLMEIASKRKIILPDINWYFTTSILEWNIKKKRQKQHNFKTKHDVILPYVN